MPDDANSFQAQLDGRPASAADLTPLAFAGFAHFTAMQVRNGRVRGLDLHLARLRSASVEFFDRALPDERVRSYLRTAIESGPGNLSLTATMFSRSGEFTTDGLGEEPAVLVRTGPPSNGPSGPLRLAAVEHERPLAPIKHVGEATKTYYFHQAARQGFDDAAFVDTRGRLSEATIWNLVFWDGEAVVWPEAAMLTGTTMSIVQRQLDQLGVPQRREEVTLDRLRKLSGAAVMNSWTPGVAVTGIGSISTPEAASFMELLHQAWQAEPVSGL